MRIGKIVWGAVVVGALALATVASAQVTPGGGGPGGGRGGRGGFNPQQFQENIKNALQVNDEEWKALQPKVEQILNLRRDEFGGMGRGGRGGRGGEGDANMPPPGPVAKATNDLQTTLDNKDATPEQIKAKLDALRTAREKNRQDLAAARQSLKELLTQRQEAVLVTMGILE